MLGALRLGAPHGVPVLGVNLGRLGYLTEVDAAHPDTVLSALGKGEYTIEARTGLALVPRDDVAPRFAYKDVVLTRVPGRGQAALALRIDGELLVRYASDGVIAATPQGSSAYAFAAGGSRRSAARTRRPGGNARHPPSPRGGTRGAGTRRRVRRARTSLLGVAGPAGLADFDLAGQKRSTI
jgi:ATP-NAD kinase C-terminal domain/ATP-NAD kinase N-terminal domain